MKRLPLYISSVFLDPFSGIQFQTPSSSGSDTLKCLGIPDAFVKDVYSQAGTTPEMHILWSRARSFTCRKSNVHTLRNISLFSRVSTHSTCCLEYLLSSPCLRDNSFCPKPSLASCPGLPLRAGPALGNKV